MRLSDSEATTQEHEGLEGLLDFLKRSRGFDFRAYKKSTLLRRIQRRMSMVGAESFADYTDRLETDPDEFAELFNTFLINVTSFFRDGEAWQFISHEVLPKLLHEQKRKFDPIRAWSAGCATGEEAFTIAMVLAESLGPDEFRQRVKIYATDIDDHALKLARQATFDSRQMESVPAEMADRYFEKVNGNYCFRRDLRRSVVFGRHDILQDAPISRIDLLVCRNTLMYFNAAAQSRILARMHFSLTENGYLFLGRAETMLAHTSTFRPVDFKQRIFAKMENVRLTPQLYLLSSDHGGDGAEPADDSMHEKALNTTGVAQLVIDRGGHLVVINDLARQWFGLTRRDVGNLFHNLELSYRPVELRSLIHKSYAEARAIGVEPVEFDDASGERMWVETQVIPLPGRGDELSGVSVIFTDVTASRRLQQALERTNLDFESTAEQLQSANEELETTNEELQSAVEELETTNEELQASYEELETMNEELQSTNEELQAINDVARQYTGELNTANHLLESIFTGLGGRVIVVDSHLNISYWSEGAEDLWGVRSDEALNSPLMNLDVGLPLRELEAPLERILEGKQERETLNIPATNRRGKSIVCHLTVLPLRAEGGRAITGAIILMSDKPGV